MRYTYLFTQISREENGELVPVTDTQYEFVFTFGKKIETFLGESSDNTVLLTKEMWKEHPATNKEILPCVCFSTPSKQGFRRPLVMSKNADKREGEYKYEMVYDNEVKDGKYLSDDIRRLTETFVNGVRAINNDAMPKTWSDLENANVKYLLSYVKSYVYVQLLQDRDNIGKKRSEDYLKKVLEILFSLIPDPIIDKFDKGLKAHDEIREKLEGVPQSDDDKIKALLKLQGYFKSDDDYKLFVVLRRYILKVKNAFNHFVWIMYRSKIGLVSLKSVRSQLGALFGFVSKIQDDYKPRDKKKILEEICSEGSIDLVKGFLNNIQKQFDLKSMNKSHRAALCYKFHKECHQRHLSNRYKYWDSIKKEIRTLHQEEFRDLCLRYWEIYEKSTLRPCKCQHLMEKFGGFLYDKEVWESMRK